LEDFSEHGTTQRALNEFGDSVMEIGRLAKMKAGSMVEQKNLAALGSFPSSKPAINKLRLTRQHVRRYTCLHIIVDDPSTA
jgi:hypothetical protein